MKGWGWSEWEQTLPSDLVQKIHHHFVLDDTHTIEMFPH
jgi:hypothetical protein